MGAITALLNSEKGLMALGGMIAATVLVALGRMTVDQWVTFTQWIFGIYVVGKTATTIGMAITGRPSASGEAAASAPTTPAKDSST